MDGEAEQKARFARALQEAMEARKMSARQLALKMQTDPRHISKWLKRGGLPNLYEAAALAHHLRVDEDLFRNPPEVPPPPPKPYYPIEKYLLGGQERLDPVEAGEQEGLRRGRAEVRRAPRTPQQSPARRARGA